MGRLGALAEQAREIVPRIAGLKALEVVGLSTHFPSADEADKTYTLAQVQTFKAILQDLQAQGLNFHYVHAANSAAVCDVPEAYFNTVRPGIVLYGLSPSDEIQSPLELTPALSLMSAVTYVKEVPEGTPLSYGRAFTTSRPSRIASVPLGYADGYARALGNQAEVGIRGRLAPVVGRVCMDQFLVDVTDVPEVAMGDEVVVYSNRAEDPNSIESIARMLDTIPYEVVVRITSRVPRVYLNP
jgi:alanine racemase